MLAQPGEHKLDYPIYFASRQLNDAEKNYTTTEREGLSMVYAVKKFRHYLLANKFVFFVDHQALLYLVNKPCMMGRITRWLLILMEFDFTVAVRKGRTHVLADHMSQIPNGEKPIGRRLVSHVQCEEHEVQIKISRYGTLSGSGDYVAGRSEDFHARWSDNGRIY